MQVVYYVVSFVVAIMAIASGSIYIYKALIMPKYVEGRTFKALNKLISDNEIMKKALVDITEAEVLIDFHPQPDTEIYEYKDAITELSRNIKRLMSKAYMALDAISEEVEH